MTTRHIRNHYGISENECLMNFNSFLNMKCNKCDSPCIVTLRKKDNYCDQCFLLGTNHKFRAAIGKSKILTKNDKVLLCISGGPSSTMLVDLVHHGITLDIHKKLRIVPYLLHISEEAEEINGILTQCRKYGFDVYFVHISEYLNSNKKLPQLNSAPSIDRNYTNAFQDIMIKLPATAHNDFINKVKRSLFIEFAKLLSCKYIFTAENSSRLAINLLSNLAVGRGSQVQNDIGFIDTRHEDIKIVRPMKDISQEELEYYIKIKGLKPNYSYTANNNSLQTVISTFVTELQDNFQSTISTVCKTADKIGALDETVVNRKCSICENSALTKPYKLTALEATNVSRSLSTGVSVTENIPNKALFPLIGESLCYSCSKIYADLAPTCLPNIQ